MITLIHGPAELLRFEALGQIRTSIADDPDLADINTAHLDGRQATLADIENACDTLPFLAEHRLVVVRGMISHLNAPGRSRSVRPADTDAGAETAPRDELTSEAGRVQTKALLAYLDRLSPTAELVFLEDEVVSSGSVLRRLLELQRDGRARIVLCQPPKRNELPDWIRARARQRKVKLDPTAVADLADFVGDELRQIDQELIKLGDYAADGRTITRADVRQLVTATRAANIFELVEALGSGDAPVAARLLRRSLDVDAEQPLRLLSMIARQYRLLLQAKALQAQGVKAPEIAQAVNVQEWTVPKLLNQAGRHSFARLEKAMEAILAADEAIKTGKAPDREMMDVLMAELLEG